VVDDAIDHRRGRDLVAENITPAGKREVAGQDQRGVFVSGRDESEEQVRGVLLERDVSDFVDDDQSVTAQPGEFDTEPARQMRGLQSRDPVDRGGE
jgi:hypothetical protein